MRKIYTITFHSSYNHGSNLQSYALQEFISNLSDDIDYKIINLRTNLQDKMYKYNKKDKNIKNLIKDIVTIKFKKNILEKEKMFELFINNNLKITKEYKSFEELVSIFKTSNDYFISGSDQIWNVRNADFDWSYYLEFTNSKNKISYAASFGSKSVNLNSSEENRIISDLKKYKDISVRDQKSKDRVASLIDINPDINVDPTLLISKEQWDLLSFDKAIIKEKYIVLYDLYGNEDAYKIANYFKRKLNLNVYLLREIPIAFYKYKFKHHFNTGPLEFLNILKNSELIISSSFHGTIFSIIFNKPFYAVNGLDDNRINTLLKSLKLEDRCVSINNMDSKITEAFNINFDIATKIIDNEKEKSKNYLKKALNISD